MSRANKRETHLRRCLETIASEVAFIQKVSPVTKLRVQQGMEQSGMTGLFQPALIEIDDVSGSVSVIKDQVTSALGVLLEKDACAPVSYGSSRKNR